MTAVLVLAVWALLLAVSGAGAWHLTAFETLTAECEPLLAPVAPLPGAHRRDLAVAA